jgi:hypothetical protein
MKPIKGLSMDTRPEDQPEGSYPFGKNGVQYDLKGGVVNEEGFKPLGKFIPAGYQINGILETDTERVIIFFTNNIESGVALHNFKVGINEYEFGDASLPYKLGFNIENYITGEVQRNHKGELICAFTDKVTFPKFINFNSPDTATLNSWKLFPEFQTPIISTVITAGGNTAVGSYYVSVRYIKSDGSVTSFSEVTSAIIVINDNEGDFADKSIQINLSNLDSAYKFIEVAVISKVKGVTSTVLLNKISVISNGVVTYSGDSTHTVITLEEVLTPNAHYDKIGTMAQLNDALYIGNLEKTPDIIDMQVYANLIQLQWKSELAVAIAPGSIATQNSSGKKKGFMHEEAYAFYIRYKLTNSSFTTAFHIPGVKPTASQLLTSTVGTVGGLNALKYEIEDCISIYSSTTLTGITGPYQNKTEVYPNTDEFNSIAQGGEDLRNTPVRHHKMPSLRWCKKYLYANDNSYGIGTLDQLGISALNVQIPPKYANLIVGYEILYAKRSTDNMTNYGTSQVLYGMKKSGDPVTVYTGGHNWNVNGYSLNKDHCRLHGFDLLLNRPGVFPAFLSHQYRMKVNIDTKYSRWSFPTGGAVTDSKGCSVFLADTNVAPNFYQVGTNYVNGLDNPKWVKNHTVLSEYQNSYMETVLAGKLLGPQQVSSSANAAPITGYGITSADVYIANIMDVKKDIYTSFYSQPLISAGDYKLLTDLTPFWHGDVFPANYTYHTYGIMDAQWDVPESLAGGLFAYPEARTRRIVNRFICEVIANHYARYEIPGNIYSKWYDHNLLNSYSSASGSPTSALIYPLDYNSTVDPNQFGYNRGSEGINDFRIADIFNPYKEYISKFPYRVHRGGKLSRQNTRSWRTFLALDYYEMQKNMGFLINLESMEDRLLIHHENALFVTQDKAKLESGLLAVTLGTGDIFQFEPQEVQNNSHGFAGTQHDLACVKTPIGYIFPDARHGELYIYGGKQVETLNQDLHRFIKEYLTISGKNCFNGNSITIGYDQKYRRFLVTVNNVRPKNVTEPYELSLELIKGLTITNDLEITSNGSTANTIIPIGSYVFMNGKFLEYMGLNVPGTTGGTCAPDILDCPAAYNIQHTTIGNLTTVTYDIGASQTSSFSVYEQTNTGWVLLLSGSNGSMGSGMFNFNTVGGVIYKVEVTAECSLEVVGVVTSYVFSDEVVIPPSPICESAGIVQQWINSPAALIPIPAPANTYQPTAFNMAWRIRVNNGTWSPENEMGAYQISAAGNIQSKLGSPLRNLDLLGYACCSIEVEFGNVGSGSWITPVTPTDPSFTGPVYWPGDPLHDMTGLFGIEGLATRAIDDSNVLNVAPGRIGMPLGLATSVLLHQFNITGMDPDVTTQYNGIDHFGNPGINGYSRWTMMNIGWHTGIGVIGGSGGSTATPTTIQDASSIGFNYTNNNELPLIIYKP